MPKQPANATRPAASASTATVRHTSKTIGLLLGVSGFFSAGTGWKCDMPLGATRRRTVSIRKLGHFTSGIVLYRGLVCHASVNDTGPRDSQNGGSRKSNSSEFSHQAAVAKRPNSDRGRTRSIASGRPPGTDRTELKRWESPCNSKAN